MAGGAGQRMRASGGSSPKPLAPVRGVPLVERNLLALLGAGFRDVKISVPLGHDGLTSWLDQRGEALAGAVGARLERIEEPRPLGSMGAAALLANCYERLLVVFADNLTSLDLRALLARHETAGAALTIATHDQRFRLPYGCPRVDGDRVVAFVEKPDLTMTVSSGLYVLGPAALATMEPGTAIGAPALLAALLARGGSAPVMRFQHASPWIDVNDVHALVQAEELVAEVPTLECWASHVDRERVTVLLGRAGRWLVDRTETPGDGAWELPGVPLEPGSNPAEAAHVAGFLGPAIELSHCTVFDDIELTTGEIVRHHVLRAAAKGEPAVTGGRWVDPMELPHAVPLRWSTRRALAYAQPRPERQAATWSPPRVDRTG
jgi:NDP-mannose synthase